MDWSKLSLQYSESAAIVFSKFKDGQWSKPEISKDPNFSINGFAGVFNYGCSCFEGLKAFRGADNKIRLFRPNENAQRLQRSAQRLGIAAPPLDLFVDMCVQCVRSNIEYLPPFGYNGSMYLRPVLEGIDPGINICSSKEVLFVVQCLPLGAYHNVLEGVDAVISRNYDRAAPNGTGAYKIGANYAISMYPYNIARNSGYKELLFLDPATKTKIDEFGSSNFFAIKGDKYITPLSDSVLPSITNKSLQTLASDIGLSVEKRAIMVEELSDFEEVAACGTAVVVTPIKKIDDKPTLEGSEISHTYKYKAIENYSQPSIPDASPAERAAIVAGFGSSSEIKSVKLYHLLRSIQDGLENDYYDWCMMI